jgi:hypothetical protein
MISVSRSDPPAFLTLVATTISSSTCTASRGGDEILYSSGWERAKAKELESEADAGRKGGIEKIEKSTITEMKVGCACLGKIMIFVQNSLI